jgi:ABC-type polysaccharide/polyol phosphate transport system ATPase subunit
MEPVSTLKEHVIRLAKGQRTSYREFPALDNVTLDIPTGQSLGIIGRNGAGKSTLLKVISRILRPTSGRVRVSGRVAPLIELGAGFHPELTGRENVFLNGAILGFSHSEMQEKFDSIVAFSELGEFIDAPVRTYSSGMKVRLGFAIASDVDPDILLVDEVLSVGDEAFQEKCRARLGSFRARGVTILYVTHDLNGIGGLCGRAILLERGAVLRSGEVDVVISAYRGLLAKTHIPTSSVTAAGSAARPPR